MRVWDLFVKLTSARYPLVRQASSCADAAGRDEFKQTTAIFEHHLERCDSPVYWYLGSLVVIRHRSAPRAQSFRSLRSISRHGRIEPFQLQIRRHKLNRFVVDEVFLVLGECEDGLEESSVRQHPGLHILVRILLWIAATPAMDNVKRNDANSRACVTLHQAYADRKYARTGDIMHEEGR